MTDKDEYTTVQVRVSDATARAIYEIARQADVSPDQAASVIAVLGLRDLVASIAIGEEHTCSNPESPCYPPSHDEVLPALPGDGSAQGGATTGQVPDGYITKAAAEMLRAGNGFASQSAIKSVQITVFAKPQPCECAPVFLTPPASTQGDGA